jgi:predicted HD phosphohydrolase
MANLYADEDFPLPVVMELRNLGHDVLTAYEAGQANQGIPDPDVLAFAISLSRAVLTRNRWDFIRLHKHAQRHCGIIVCADDPDFFAQAQKIHQAILNCPTLDNQLLRIYRS